MHANENGKREPGAGVRKVIAIGTVPEVHQRLVDPLSAHAKTALRVQGISADAFLAHPQRWQADVLLFDATLAPSEVSALMRASRAIEHPPRTIRLHPPASERDVAELLRLGVHGIVACDAGGKELVRAVAAVAAGYAYVRCELLERCLGTSNAVVAADTATHAFDPVVVGALTRREREILSLMGAGLSVEQIAKRLHVSPRTVTTHRDHIRSKLRLPNAASVLRTAVLYHLEAGRTRTGSTDDEAATGS